MPTPVSSAPHTPVSASAAVGCHHCGLHAKFFVSQVSAKGHVTSRGFCLAHALQAGLLQPNAWDLLGPLPSSASLVAAPSCRCGITEAALRKGGRVGCVHCYRVFAHLFRPLLARLHPGTQHTGKCPRRAKASARPAALRARASAPTTRQILAERRSLASR